MDYLRCAAGAVSDHDAHSHRLSLRSLLSVLFRLEGQNASNTQQLIPSRSSQGLPAAIASFAIAKNRNVAVS